MADLVLAYDLTLSKVVGERPELSRYLASCKHCRIRFLTDPRNAGRDDLGCPFGCAAAHRRRTSGKRSAAFYQRPAGKLKKALQNQKRRRSKKRSASEDPKAPEAPSPAPAEATPPATVEAAQRPDFPIVGPASGGSSIDPPGALADEPVAVLDPPTDSAARAVPPRDTGRGGERCDPRPLDPGLTSGGGLPRAEPGLERDSGIVRYVRRVVSLVEGRPVGFGEIFAMLERTRRQHSFAREKRIDYVLRSLREESEKPP